MKAKGIKINNFQMSSNSMSKRAVKDIKGSHKWKFAELIEKFD